MPKDYRQQLDDIGVNTAVVWDVVTKKLDELDAACRKLLSEG